MIGKYFEVWIVKKILILMLFIIFLKVILLFRMMFLIDKLYYVKLFVDV